ncbi:MAG: PAS domain S-box protein, partial [Spirochaetes bacterium]|nr:PAS domain S-box protein [Spirochaetota bacterium]
MNSPLLSDSMSDSIITSARARLVDTTLMAFAVFSLLSMVFSTLRSIDIGWQPIFAVHILLFAVLVALCLFRGRIGTGVKINTAIATFILIGLAGFIQLGIASGGIIFIVVGCVLAVSFSEIRTAVIYVAVTIAGLSLLAYLHTGGFIVPTVNLDAYNSHWTSWLNLLMRFAVFTLILVVAVARLNWQYLTLFHSEQDRSRELRDSKEELQRVMRSLEESERYYRLLFQGGDDAVIVYDTADGRIANVNDTVCERLGYSREELLRMAPRDLTAGGDS